MKNKKTVKNSKRVKNTKIPTYAFGGSIQDPMQDYLMLQQRNNNMPNQMESPDTELIKHGIRLAGAAQEAGNDWSKGLNMFGNLAMQAGTSIMNSADSAGSDSITPDGKATSTNKFLSKINKFGVDNFGGVGNIFGILNSSINPKFATGGITGQVPINTEGGEIIETPGGEPQELQGNSHAQGGINMQVPIGTEIYSKRLKGPDGKSMADRKKNRERQLSKLEKLIESNPTDKTIKKTLDKTKKDFQIQEQQDIQKMQMMHQMTQVQQAMEHFVTGGISGFPYPVPNWMGWNNNFTRGKLGDTLNINPFENFEHIRGGYNNNKSNNKASGNEETADKIVAPNAKTNTTQGGLDILNRIFGGSEGLPMGDMIGLGGQLYSTFAPMKNTQTARAGDTPNINAFKNYGEDALAKMDQSKQYVNQMRDENLKDLELSRTGQILRNRNSSMGLNTQRALDLTTDTNMNDTKSKIFNQFAQAMQDIYKQEAALENDQDVHVMQGEYNRDLADREDRDNYFSQMAQDIATKGTGLQNIGKNINEIKERNITSNVMDSLFPDFNMDIYTGKMKKIVTGVASQNFEFLKSIPNKENRDMIIDKVAKREWYIDKNKVYSRGDNKEVKFN